MVMFNQSESKKTDTEVKLGIEFVDRDVDPYSFNIGLPVTAVLPRGTIQGIYRGITREGQAIFLPSMRSQIRAEGEHNYSSKVEILETERPSACDPRGIVAMIPLSETELSLMNGRSYSDGKCERNG